MSDETHWILKHRAETIDRLQQATRDHSDSKIVLDLTWYDPLLEGDHWLDYHAEVGSTVWECLFFFDHVYVMVSLFNSYTYLQRWLDTEQYEKLLASGRIVVLYKATNEAQYQGFLERPGKDRHGSFGLSWYPIVGCGVTPSSQLPVEATEPRSSYERYLSYTHRIFDQELEYALFQESLHQIPKDFLYRRKPKKWPTDWGGASDRTLDRWRKTLQEDEELRVEPGTRVLQMQYASEALDCRIALSQAGFNSYRSSISHDLLDTPRIFDVTRIPRMAPYFQSPRNSYAGAFDLLETRPFVKFRKKAIEAWDEGEFLSSRTLVEALEEEARSNLVTDVAKAAVYNTVSLLPGVGPLVAASANAAEIAAKGRERRRQFAYLLGSIRKKIRAVF